MAGAAYRVEKDTLGEVRVPKKALWGAQTQRAVENFPVSGLRAHPAMIRAYVLVKKASAVANFRHATMKRELAAAISDACDELLSVSTTESFATLARRGRKKAPRREEHDKERFVPDRGDDLRFAPFRVPVPYVSETYREQFVVDVFQAGAGTSFNMNCNEVIANLANVTLGGKKGIYDPIHPNDHVNMAQSTNDTYPTASRLAILMLLRELFPALDGLAFALASKGDEFSDVIKSGRTHLQDAVPVTLGQEFHAWAGAVRRSTDLLLDAANQLRYLGIGGTATGTGINTPAGYRYTATELLGRLSGIELQSIPDLREGMQSQLAIAAVSAALRNLALELTRITNDLRLLSSGPLTGLAEIILPAVQPGSSIMPGKVNPSMLECLNQVCFHVIGADTAVAFGVQAGQLELNVMMPMMAFEVLFSIDILKNYLPVFTARCISGIQADRERCESYYNTSPSLATALNPFIGYEAAAKLAKESAMSHRPIPELIREKKLLSEEQIQRIFTPEFLAGQADRKVDAEEE